MSEKLRDVLIYLCQRYPNPSELSKARLTKMVYLGDWRSALTRGRQLTDIRWRFNHYGPYVDDVVDLARKDPLFEVLSTANHFGSPKDVITLRQVADPRTLDPDEKAILDYVVEVTAPMFWDQFIKLVYSTYPVLTEPRYSELDLPALANEYRGRRDLLVPSPGLASRT